MTERVFELSYEVELQPGEKLELPAQLVESVGVGRWLVSVRPLADGPGPVRRHDAFLRGYAAGDEGLYDDAGG